MKALFEVVILPVSDPDASLRFYRDQLRFHLDVDYAPVPDFRVIQLTPKDQAHQSKSASALPTHRRARCAVCTWSFPTLKPAEAN